MICKYRCQKCKFEFEMEKPGMVYCQKCGYLWIDWLNYKEVLRLLGRKG